jgi:hypothetical protein
VPEVRQARADGDDQTVVRDLTAATDRAEDYEAGLEIDIDDFAKKDPRVPLVAETSRIAGAMSPLERIPSRADAGRLLPSVDARLNSLFR